MADIQANKAAGLAESALLYADAVFT
jgi:hypothetical protein